MTPQAIADSMERDGLTFEKVSGMSESQRTELTLAYVQAEIKKTEQMQDMYLTNPGFKNRFRAEVLSLCKQ